MRDDLPTEHRVTPRLPRPVSFLLRLLLVLAILALVVGAGWVAIEADGEYVRWQAGR